MGDGGGDGAGVGPNEGIGGRTAGGRGHASAEVPASPAETVQGGAVPVRRDARGGPNRGGVGVGAGEATKRKREDDEGEAAVGAGATKGEAATKTKKRRKKKRGKGAMAKQRAAQAAKYGTDV